MPVAAPIIAASLATYAVGGAAATVFAGTALAMTGATFGAIIGGAVSVGFSLLSKPKSPDLTSPLNSAGAGRTQQLRQPTAAHEAVFGRVKKSGGMAFTHSKADDEGRADGYFYIQHTIAFHQCESIGDVYFNDELATAAKFTGYAQIGRNLGASDQVEDANFLADLGEEIFGDHWLRGRTNLATRIKIKPEPFPNGIPNISAIVSGNNQIYDPR